MADAQKLIEAAGTGDAEVIHSLLSSGLDVNAPNGGGETALIRAAGNGQAEMVRLLLHHGANVNAKTADGMTPLIRAAFFGHPEAARLLMLRGADLSARDRLGSTAMDWALAKGHDEVAETLSQPLPLESEEETLIQQPLKTQLIQPAPQASPARADQSIAPSMPPPQEIPQNIVAEASPATATAEEDAPEEELTIPREAVPERKPLRAARAARPLIAVPAPSIGRQEIPVSRPAEKNNYLHIALTTLVIFLISGGVVYTITAGLRRSTVSQEQPENSVDAPTTINADPTPVATPATKRTEAEAQPATALDANAMNANRESVEETSAQAPSSSVSLERVADRSRSNAPTVTRTARVVETRDSSTVRATRRTERADENRRNEREQENSERQRREAVVRDSASQRTPVNVSTPVPNPPPPTAKKKVIQWP